MHLPVVISTNLFKKALNHSNTLRIWSNLVEWAGSNLSKIDLFAKIKKILATFENLLAKNENLFANARICDLSICDMPIKSAIECYSI